MTDASQPIDTTLPLSVVVASTEPWPDLQRCLAVLLPQVSALGGEILVGDGVGNALDAATVEASNGVLQWIKRPGASVFELRAACLSAARGAVIAITEDHCIVGDNWCAEILRGFEQHPDAWGLTGLVMNGSTASRVAWANFIHTFGAFMPPGNPGQQFRAPPIANVAYRRDALGPGPYATGWLEFAKSPRIFRAGRFAVREEMTVAHVQPYRFWQAVRAHFDNGRSTTGIHRAPFSWRRMPWKLYRDTIAVLPPSALSQHEVRRSLPMVRLLSWCHAAGELMGAIAGPGRSPERLR